MKAGPRTLTLKLVVKSSGLAFKKGPRMAMPALLTWRNVSARIASWFLFGPQGLTEYIDPIIAESIEGFFHYSPPRLKVSHIYFDSTGIGSMPLDLLNCLFSCCSVGDVGYRDLMDNLDQDGS